VACFSPHDVGIDPAGRVAGALVVLFARPAAASRRAVDDLKIEQGRVALRLGDTPFELPEPLAGHMRELVTWRRSLAAAALPAHEHWLFPGAPPGRPVDEPALGRRLRRRGIHCAANRRTALLELSRYVPARAGRPARRARQHRHQVAELAGRHRAAYLRLRQDG
jgi:hypothetical protein